MLRGENSEIQSVQISGEEHFGAVCGADRGHPGSVDHSTYPWSPHGYPFRAPIITPFTK